MHTKPISLDFQLHPEQIDYFKFEKSYFKGLSPVIEKVKLSNNEKYITASHLASIGLSEKETVVFNFQVGQGKTEFCYDLAKAYFDDGYYVIMCSPFLNLVEKDKKALIERFPKSTNSKVVPAMRYHSVYAMESLEYTDEASGNVLLNYETQPYTKRIHVMK